jgi:hypothetical protein
MLLNIVCTSKPIDGLFFYSYEYCSLLNNAGIKTNLVVICHRKFLREDYIEAIKSKYIHCENIVFDAFSPDPDDITLIMGRSMLTLPWQNFNSYSKIQQETLKQVFKNKLISVYSENHPSLYPKAIDFYSPTNIIDLCDFGVYPNGVGYNFEKIINFEIYKPKKDEIKFKYLFLGTNDKYYQTIEKVISDFSDHGILVSDYSHINSNLNNVLCPVDNLMGIFETYVYTKDTFDPAPRIIQECKYFNKNIIYLRDTNIIDGGSVYWKRELKNPDIGAIIKAYSELS